METTGSSQNLYNQIHTEAVKSTDGYFKSAISVLKNNKLKPSHENVKMAIQLISQFESEITEKLLENALKGQEQEQSGKPEIVDDDQT